MSGLRDEGNAHAKPIRIRWDKAVEAMARMLDPAAWGEWAAPGKEEAQADALRRGAILLAALPAGVWHSDGQGHVTPWTEDEAVAAMAASMEPTGLEDLAPRLHHAALWTRAALMRNALAALSATDTENGR